MDERMDAWICTNLESLPRGAISDVYFAVTSAAAHQQAGHVGRVLDEANVADRAVVHR